MPLADIDEQGSPSWTIIGAKNGDYGEEAEPSLGQFRKDVGHDRSSWCCICGGCHALRNDAKLRHALFFHAVLTYADLDLPDYSAIQAPRVAGRTRARAHTLRFSLCTPAHLGEGRATPGHCGRNVSVTDGRLTFACGWRPRRPTAHFVHHVPHV